MKTKILVLIIAALFLASCVAKENDSTSGSFLVINSLTGNDLQGAAGSTTAFSDVLTDGSIINDNAVAEVNAEIYNPANDADLSYFNDVMVDQIDVEFKRTDGRNVEGVDVPYRFTQPVNMLVVVDTPQEIPFVLIRHVAKMEAPLLALRETPSQSFVLQLVAKVTFHGKDLGGHRVAPVSGYLSVWCANFADPAARSRHRHPRRSTATRRREMKKILFILIMVVLVLGVSSCKRSEIDDPIWDDPAGFETVVEGSVTPALQLIDGRIHTSQIFIKVTDAKGNPKVNRTVFLEQLPDPTSHTQINWGYFADNRPIYQKNTDANGEVRVTFYWPTEYFSEEMWIHAIVVIDGRAYKTSEQGVPGNIPQDFISLTMWRALD